MSKVFDTGGLIGAEKLYSNTTFVSPGEAQFSTPGSYTWTAPAGVTSVSVLCVGAGGGGGGSGQDAGSGGGGGALSWKNNISVTPGANYTVTVGLRGALSTGTGGTGGQSFFSSNTVVSANGGVGGASGTQSGGLGGTRITGAFDGGGNGGQGGDSTTNDASDTTREAGAGGGAAGYSGNGGRGAGTNQSNGSAGTGGGGGGGGSQDSGAAGGGGGVGILGEGTSGTGGTGSNRGGGGSSGEGGSSTPTGGLYGGGGAGSDATTSGDGANGAVRIIWGSNRSYPSTNVSNGQGGTIVSTVYDSGIFNLNAVYDSRNIPMISEGMLIYLDAAKYSSYPGTGNIWYNLASSNNHANLTSTSYTTDAGGGIVFGNGSDGFPIAATGASALNFSGGGFTISVWLRHTGTVSTARIQRYFTLQSSPSEGPVIRHGSGSNAELEAYLFDAGNTFRRIGIANQVLTNTYYNFVYTYNGTTFKVYNNGVEVGSSTLTITLPTPTSAGYLLASATEYFEGNMYIVCFYNRGLTAAEIGQNFNAFRGRFGI